MKHEAPPIPNKRDNAIQDVDSGNAIFVAAFPSVPTAWPINNWSTMLYSAPTIIAIILGTENLSISLEIGSDPNGFLVFSTIYPPNTVVKIKFIKKLLYFKALKN